MKNYGTQIESWGPFAQERKDLFNNQILLDIGNKYNKSASQVILRWLIQRNIVAIPKSVHKERMIENFNIFDFELSADGMNKIYGHWKKRFLSYGCRIIKIAFRHKSLIIKNYK